MSLEPNVLLIEFGKRVRDVRKSRRLTQEELARKLKMNPAQVSLIETAQREPRLKTVFRIAAALGVDPRELIPPLRR